MVVKILADPLATRRQLATSMVASFSVIIGTIILVLDPHASTLFTPDRL